MKNFTTWADVRNNFMTTEEISECDKWLAELEILMNRLDAGEISQKEYRKLCFELDKKYNLADDKDEEFYFDDEENHLLEVTKMNRDKNGFVIFDDDFRREMMKSRQFDLSNKHSDEFKKLFTKFDSGEITEQEYNELSQELEAKHTSEYEKLYAEEHKEKNYPSIDFNSMAVANF